LFSALLKFARDIDFAGYDLPPTPRRVKYTPRDAKERLQQKLPKFTTNLQSRNNFEILLQYSSDSDMALLTGRVSGQLGWARLSSLFFKEIFNSWRSANAPA
jgi:hypothetical protein